MRTQRHVLRKALGGAPLTVLLAICGGWSFAADVGDAVMVRSDVQGTPRGGTAKAMAVGDGVGLGLALVTAEASGIKMTFDPHGSLTLGPSTRMTIEESVVDQATGRKTSKLSMAVGRLRVAIGELFGGEVEVTTPSAVVGIKGTEVVLVVDRSGRTTVIVREGRTSLRSQAGGASIDVSEGHFALVDPGGPAGAAAPFDALASDLLEQALGNFGMPLLPPASRPKDQAAGAAFAGKRGPSGAVGNLALVTASPAAGGAAFTDPALSAFPISPFFSLAGRPKPQ